MVRVADYTTIVGPGESVTLGDTGVDVWEEKFKAGGVVQEDPAHFLIEFQGLVTHSAEVELNEDRVGRLHPYEDPDPLHTQIVDFPAEKLNQGQNEIEIKAVDHPEVGWGEEDDFRIENVVCHYHQIAGDP